MSVTLLEQPLPTVPSELGPYRRAAYAALPAEPRKLNRYAEGGVRGCWTVDSAARTTGFSVHDGECLVGHTRESGPWKLLAASGVESEIDWLLAVFERKLGS